MEAQSWALSVKYPVLIIEGGNIHMLVFHIMLIFYNTLSLLLLELIWLIFIISF